MQTEGIGQFHPATKAEAACWSRITAFVAQQGLNAFSRNPHIGGHITGSAFVLSPDGASVLLTHHRKLDKWLQLGGHCDGIADVRFVAMKEAYEESGLARITCLSDTVFDVDIHEIPARGEEPAHLHLDIRYLMQARVGEPQVSDESHDLAWVPLADMESYSTEPSLLRMRNKVQRLQK